MSNWAAYAAVCPKLIYFFAQTFAPPFPVFLIANKANVFFKKRSDYSSCIQAFFKKNINSSICSLLLTEMSCGANFSRFQIRLASRVLNVRFSPLQRDVDFPKWRHTLSRSQTRTSGNLKYCSPKAKCKFDYPKKKRNTRSICWVRRNLPRLALPLCIVLGMTAASLCLQRSKQAARFSHELTTDSYFRME